MFVHGCRGPTRVRHRDEGADLVDVLTSLTGHVAEVSGTVAVGLVLADGRGDLQFAAASQESVFTPRALSAGFRSVFALPMRHHQDVIGSLSLSDTRTDPFSPEDLRVVRAMANIATIGILHEPVSPDAPGRGRRDRRPGPATAITGSRPASRPITGPRHPRAGAVGPVMRAGAVGPVTH